MHFVSIFLLLFISNLMASPFEYHGYFRSGVGHTLGGQKQICFNNPGSSGNEFRLGNECGTYGEMSLGFNLTEGQAHTYKLINTIAYFPNGNTQYGDESSTNDLDFVETYLHIKDTEVAPFEIWAGKRFYRDADIHMNDFYYFAQMNGVGAGIQNWNLLGGKFSLAYIQENQVSSSVSGEVTKSFFDLRFFDYKISENQNLNFWYTYGISPGGKLGTTNYQKLSGQSFGIRHSTSLNSFQNNFAILYGTKLMDSLNVYGDTEIKNQTRHDDKYKLRLVDVINSKLSEKLELQLATTYEIYNNGIQMARWWNIGFRPVYFLTNKLHLLTEVGTSQVKNQTSLKQLHRATIAFEINPNNSFWSRPSFRTFYSKTFWNDQNRSSFSGKKSGQNLGVQVEAWF